MANLLKCVVSPQLRVSCFGRFDPPQGDGPYSSTLGNLFSACTAPPSGAVFLTAHPATAPGPASAPPSPAQPQQEGNDPILPVVYRLQALLIIPNALDSQDPVRVRFSYFSHLTEEEAGTPEVKWSAQGHTIAKRQGWRGTQELVTLGGAEPMVGYVTKQEPWREVQHPTPTRLGCQPEFISVIDNRLQ